MVDVFVSDKRIPPYNQQVKSGRYYLDLMLDTMDLLPLIDGEKDKGFSIIAKTLHKVGVSPFDVGFAVYDMQHPRTSVDNHVLHTYYGELRVDGDSAERLKTEYLKGKNKKVAEQFARGEKASEYSREDSL